MDKIRIATMQDAARFVEIYAPYVLETTASYETSPPNKTVMQERIAATVEKFPWLVYERDGKILAYAYAGRLGERAGYDWSCTTSVYADMACRGQGIGKLLYEALFKLLKQQGYRMVYAVVAHPNPQSGAFHNKMGFEQMGVLKNAGYKFGKVLGVEYYGRELLPVMQNPPRPVPFGGLSADIVERILAARG